VILPRFKVEYGSELKDALNVLGMGVAFGGGANFSHLIEGPAFISNVLHKAFVEVNEEGTEAAGATVVIIAKGGIEKTFRMVVDRPFFFAIRDNETGSILFMGCVVDPKE
jgi:serpin B